MTTRDEETAAYLERCTRDGRELRITTLDAWRSPATAYNPGSAIGRARIARRRYSGYYMGYGSRGADIVQFSRRVPITCLEIGGKTWMVDDPPHLWDIEGMHDQPEAEAPYEDAPAHLRGHVLAANERVTSVRVIERDPDVIALIGPHVAGLCEIVEGDLYAHIGDPCDVAFVDLWVTHTRDETLAVLAGEVVPLAARLRDRGVPMFALGFTGTRPILREGA